MACPYLYLLIYIKLLFLTLPSEERRMKNETFIIFHDCAVCHDVSKLHINVSGKKQFFTDINRKEERRSKRKRYPFFYCSFFLEI